MVHNGIEYGLMAAYAEGLNILRHANVGKEKRAVDAETTPLAEPELYQYDLDLPEITEVWRRGSVDRVVAARPHGRRARAEPGARAEFAGRVSDSGEGRWTLKAAIDEGVPAPILSRPSRSASRLAARRTSPTAFSLRCASSSAATWRSGPERICDERPGRES